MLLLSQAPGVGGGERVVIPALARASELDVTVAGHEPVCRFAEEVGLHAVRLELPWVRGWLEVVPLAAGALRVRSLARRRGADVLYANGTRAMSYAVGARALGGPPVIAHHHGLLTAGPVGSLVWGLRRWADVIIVPSRASGEPFGDAAKMRLVPNGIDLGRFRLPDDPVSARRALGLPEDAAVVGTVSRADPRKGMGSFLRVAAAVARMLPEVHFLLAGGAIFPHEEPHHEQVRRDAAGLLGDRVVLTGRLDDPLIAFQAMDVFVHPSEPEAFPTTVIEAMACGLPVVAYAWGGATEIVEDGATGLLVPPKDEEAAAVAVMRLLTEREFAVAAGAAARARCLERYDVERFARELAGIVTSLVRR